MNLLKMRTEEPFSTEGLINVLGEIEVTEIYTTLNIEIDFKDAVVFIKGSVQGHFHDQKMTYDNPQYSDLYDVSLKLSDVTVSYNKEDFEKRVRNLMLN